MSSFAVPVVPPLVAASTLMTWEELVATFKTTSVAPEASVALTVVLNITLE